jgi:hypothetical protein
MLKIEINHLLIFFFKHKDEEAQNKKMSFVFSEDVTKLILSIIDKISKENLKKELLNQSYNIACEEAITTEELVNLIVPNK